MTSFDEAAWRARCSEMSNTANKGCGLIYELFSSRYSVSVEKAIAELPEQDRARALEIATEDGCYATPEERAEWSRGCCSHFLDPNCCPMGCGDLEWD